VNAVTDVVLTRETLQPFVDAQWVTARRHPTLPLTIYNYTPRCVFAKHWTRETLACRGLALDDEDAVVLRPFGKFFNASEIGGVPDGFHHCYEKMDGSLFLLGTYDGEIVTATRGSFTSPQAEIGRRLIEQMDWVLNTGLTWCFELITPGNRIVVDYGDDERLVLLAVMDNGTGRTMTDHWPPFETAPYVRRESMADTLADPARQRNREGFVLHFPVSDQRVKVKFEEYVRLHRIVTGITARHIWERMSAGRPLDDLLELVPDEFYQWGRDTERDLADQFEEFDRKIRAQFGLISRLAGDDRKAFAEYVRKLPVKSKPAMFHLFDGKPIDQLVWKMIRPASERPFRSDEA
jgi:RNA ligase